LLAGPESSRIECGSDVERLDHFSDAIFAFTVLAYARRGFDRG
jgi:hypothetical protein